MQVCIYKYNFQCVHDLQLMWIFPPSFFFFFSRPPLLLFVCCCCCFPLLLCDHFTEKTWFTDEPENAFPRNIQIKPMNTHVANQVNQYKPAGNPIPTIREVEDEC